MFSGPRRTAQVFDAIAAAAFEAQYSARGTATATALQTAHVIPHRKSVLIISGFRILTAMVSLTRQIAVSDLHHLTAITMYVPLTA